MAGAPASDNKIPARYALTVIMPAYNEADGISDAVNEVRTEVLDIVDNSRLLVVNDGSKDNTGAILDELAKSDPRVHVLHKTNGGHGPALVKALNQADSEYVFLVDSDMQIPLSCFQTMWNLTSQYDAVLGVRQKRDDPKFRIILSRFIGHVLRTMFGVSLVDANAPCKVLRLQIWKELYARISDETMMAPSLVISIYAKKHNYRVKDLAVPHRARTRGESVLKIKPLLRFCHRAFMQMMTYKDKLN